MYNGPSRHDIDRFFATEIARLNAAIADLFAVAEEQYNTNEQLQRELNCASAEIERLSNKQARIRIILGELFSSHFRACEKTNSRLSKLETKVGLLTSKLSQLRLN